MIKVGAGVRLIPGRLAFDLWNELKTLPAVQEELLRRGYHGLRSEDVPPTELTISNSAWRYVLNNMDEARQEMENHGIIFDTDDDWNEQCITKATFVLGSSRGRFIKWIKDNNFERYEHIFKHRWGTVD